MEDILKQVLLFPRRETTPVRGVRKGLLAQDAPEAARADTQRGEALLLRGVREALCRPLQHDPAHEATFR